MSEFDWIEKYLKPIAKSAAAMGLSNDVAIVERKKTEARLIASMDTLVEGVHFLAADPRYTVAQKLVRVNVSDILCKGARPSQALLSIAVPQSMSEQNFADFCGGLAADLSLWEVALVGGDTVRTNGPLVLTLTIFGECIAEGPANRSGAKPGDGVFVTGTIGAGVLGLERAISGVEDHFSSHYRVPSIPPLAVADLVARFATSSIDVSDGLVADARHISEASNVSTELDLSCVPWAAAVGDSVDDMLHLATGGDDYQTLFTAAESDEDSLRQEAERCGVNLTRIGVVRPGNDVALRFNQSLVPVPVIAGFNHSI